MREEKGTEVPESHYFGLKLKYRKFVDAYLEHHGNGAAAYRSLYPNSKRPDNNAWKLLKLPEVIAGIRERADAALAAKGLRVEALLMNLLHQATFDVRKLYGPNKQLLQIPDLDAETASAIGGVEVYDTPEGRVRKYTPESKQRANLELLDYLREKKAEADGGSDEPIGRLIVEVVDAKSKHRDDPAAV